MMTWPTTLPQHAERSGYQSGTGDGRLRSSTDAGIAKLRRRFSAIPRPLQLQMTMSWAELDVFKTFVASINGGTAPFIFPSQEGPGTWIVQFGQDMPTWVVSKSRWLVTLNLVILP